MPKININEVDLTSAAVIDPTETIVFVPGFMGVNGTAEFRKPILCRTITEFESNFGTSAQSVTDENGFIGTANAEFLDRSYLMAKKLIRSGCPVIYEAVGAASGNDINALYEALRGTETETTSTPSILVELKDKLLYNPRFITSGGYGTFGYITTDLSDGTPAQDSTIVTIMEEVAGHFSGDDGRGDCVALIDHSYYSTFSQKDDVDVVESRDDFNFEVGTALTVKQMFIGIGNKYCAAFTPWWVSSDTDLTANERIVYPPSLAYLLAYTNSINNGNPTWFAAAGVTRGMISSFYAPTIEIGSIEANNLMPDNLSADSQGVVTEYRSINPICNISPYGYVIWGNRTLHSLNSGLTASSFLNVRNLCSDIKKTLFSAANRLMYEPNSNILWMNFKALIDPLLTRMLTSQGISGYKITRLPTDKKYTLLANIQIIPIEAVENFDITIVLTDEITEVTEEYAEIVSTESGLA